MKEKLKNHKKKIIISLVAVIVHCLAGIGTYYGLSYNYALKNENYNEKEIKEIALAQVNGEIIRVQKEFEIEDDQISLSEFEYEVEIKTPQNTLSHVKVSSRTGTIELDDNSNHD